MESDRSKFQELSGQSQKSLKSEKLIFTQRTAKKHSSFCRVTIAFENERGTRKHGNENEQIRDTLPHL